MNKPSRLLVGLLGKAGITIEVAQAYADAVNAQPESHHCEHGHMDCAIEDFGPCSDEALSRAESHRRGA